VSSETRTTPAAAAGDGAARDDADGAVSWRRLLFWAVFAVALFVRVAVVLDFEAHHPLAERPVIDEASYERWALEIADGDWLGDEVFFQEPLYPYALAVLYAIAGPDRTVVRLVQAVLGALTCAWIFGLTRRAFGSHLAAAIAGFGLALHPTHALMACLLLKPNLFVPLWTLLALLLVGPGSRDRASGEARERAPAEPRRLVAIGLLGGLGALLRGNALILLPLLAAWPFVARTFRWPGAPQGALRSSALIVVGVLAVLVPTAARNWYVGDVFALTTSGAGTNLFGGNNADNPYGRATEFDWVRGIPEYEAGDWEHEAERRTGRDLDRGEVSGYWMGEVWRSVRADPGLHASILWNKLRLTLGAYEVPDNHSFEWDRGFVATLRYLPPGWALWGFLGLAGVAFVLRFVRTERDALPLVWLWLAYLGTVVLTVTSMRARLPLAVWLMPFAGWYLRSWVAGTRRIAVLAACAVPAALLAWVPVLSVDERAEDLDERRFNHATYLLESEDERDLERAHAIATDLEQRYPGTARVITLVAELAARRGFALRASADGDADLLAEAQAHVQEALDRLRFVLSRPELNARERFRADVLAGTIKVRMERAGAGRSAEPHFRAALAFDPTDDRVRLELARALWLVALERRAAGDDSAAPAREAGALIEGVLARTRDPESRAALEAQLGQLRELAN